MLPILLLGLLSASVESATFLDRLHPWGWKLRLLHPDAGTRIAAFPALAGFAAAFATAGGLLFARRDL